MIHSIVYNEKLFMKKHKCQQRFLFSDYIFIIILDSIWNLSTYGIN